MLRSSSRRPKEAGFDLTPMIDIVMLLIVFFTLTAQFTRSDHRPVDLPKERGEPIGQEAPSSLFLDLDRDGQVTEGGEPVSIDDVAARIRSGGDSEGRTRLDLVLRADRHCTAARVNVVASALTKAGVKTWKLSTTGEGTVENVASPPAGPTP